VQRENTNHCGRVWAFKRYAKRYPPQTGEEGRERLSVLDGDDDGLAEFSVWLASWSAQPVQSRPVIPNENGSNATTDLSCNDSGSHGVFVPEVGGETQARDDVSQEQPKIVD